MNWAICVYNILYISSRNYIYIYIYIYICKDSICNDPQGVLGSNVKGSNNKICRKWAKRLGLGERTVVSHGVHDDCTEVNRAYPRRLSPWHGPSGFGHWTSSEEFNVLIIPFSLGYNGPRDDT